MRFLGFAAVTGAALVFAACGGGDKAAETAADSPATEAPAAAEAPAMGEMQAATGTIHEVKMHGDGQGYRFEPADITVKQGDGIKFVFVSGGPHNVAFDPATLSAEAKAAIGANMPEQAGELSGKMLLAEGETYTISFAGVPAGTYNYNCTPHIAMGMKGTITVTP
jgi:plastocyanin